MMPAPIVRLVMSLVSLVCLAAIHGSPPRPDCAYGEPQDGHCAETVLTDLSVAVHEYPEAGYGYRAETVSRAELAHRNPVVNRAGHHAVSCDLTAGLSKSSWVPPDVTAFETSDATRPAGLPATAPGRPAMALPGRSLLVLVSVSRI